MNKKQKDLIILFVGIFLLTFTILNWDYVSWMFNYKEVTGLAYDFFNPYPESPILASTVQFKPAPPAHLAGTTTVAPVVAATAYASAENSLSIASIKVATPLIIGQTTNITSLEIALDKGAVYYPGSVLPGQNGQIVILGHSAPPNWPHIKHDYIFSNLQNLVVGDEVVMHFGDKDYKYKIIGTKIIAAGKDLEAEPLARTRNILTLVSCWPPGKDYKRIAVSAELIK